MVQRYTRRDMLQRAAVLGGATAVPVRSLGQAVDASAPFEHLDSTEARTLEAIVARLIPSDEDGPGALEAGAAHYIDRGLGDALAGSREAYRAGLAALDAYARRSAGRAFADLEPAAQDRVLGALEQDTADGFTPSAAAFFELVRGHTIEGTFCDPHYGGNQDFVGWELVGYPGIRLAVAADDQRMSEAPALNRISAYDLPMFDDTGADPGAGTGADTGADTGARSGGPQRGSR